MALAVMCREYIPADVCILKAFVVDHKLRPSSTKEAIQVKDVLQQTLGEYRK
jgi:hypothetical protein